MITFDIFLLGVMGVGLITGLATQAIKSVLKEHNKTYHTNTLAGIVAVITSLLVGFGYVIVCDVALTSSVFVYMIALTIASWLGAMNGYDKIIQTILQIKNKKIDNEGM